MDEHDSLVSEALNNMTLNELANAYADLKLDLKREQGRKEAALRALARISTYTYGVSDTISPQQIAQDAIFAEMRSYGYQQDF